MLHIKFSIVFEKIKSGGGQKGVSLYFAIIILSILLAIVLGLATILVGQTRMIKGMGDSVIAFYGADTGIERILYEDKLCRLPPPCGSGTLPCKNPTDCLEGLAAGNFSEMVVPPAYEVSFNDGATRIYSIGMYSGTRRAIQVSRE